MQNTKISRNSARSNTDPHSVRSDPLYWSHPELALSTDIPLVVPAVRIRLVFQRPAVRATSRGDHARSSISNPACSHGSFPHSCSEAVPLERRGMPGQSRERDLMMQGLTDARAQDPNLVAARKMVGDRSPCSTFPSPPYTPFPPSVTALLAMT